MIVSRILGPEPARWISLFSGMFLAFTGGTLYAFGTYSVDLAAALGMEDANDVNLYGSFGDLGVYLGFVMGIFYDQFGPQATVALGGSLGFLGYFFIYLQITEVDPVLWTMNILFFAIGQGSFAVFIAAISTNVKNWPNKQNGKIVALYLFFYGLSAVVLSFVYTTVETYMFTVALLFAFATIQGLFFLELVPISPEAQKMPLVANASEDDFEEPSSKYLEDIDPSTKKHPENIATVGVRGVFRYVDFYLIFLGFAGVSGAGLMWKNDLGSVSSTFGMDDRTSNLVVTWGLVNSAIRIIVGSAADPLGPFVPRPSWVLFGAFSMFLSHVLYLITQQNWVLWVISVGTGIGYGIAFAICNALVLIYFGTESSGLKLGIASLAPAIAGFLLTFISGKLSELASDGDFSNCVIAEGVDCYFTSFLMSSICLALSMVSLAVLTFRHWRRMKRRQAPADYGELGEEDDLDGVPDT